jgi:hypothetical protein
MSGARDVILTILAAGAGGSAAQWFRMRLDRRGGRTQARAAVYRQTRSLLRGWPGGPPMLTGADDPAEASKFLADLAALADRIGQGWPDESLGYTLEHLLDALPRVVAHPGSEDAARRLYEVCSTHLVALDLGPASLPTAGWSAAPIVGSAVRFKRERASRKALRDVLPVLRHGLPMPPPSAGPAPAASTVPQDLRRANSSDSGTGPAGGLRSSLPHARDQLRGSHHE